LYSGCFLFFFFFFQAEDGIRDRNVTGVQTCALPICFLVKMDGVIILVLRNLDRNIAAAGYFTFQVSHQLSCEFYSTQLYNHPRRSEERRVGKECRSRRWRYQYKENNVTGYSRE